MEIGDPVRVKTEFGNYYHLNENVTGMVGIVIDLLSFLGGPTVLLSSGARVAFNRGHAWLEVLNESR